mmetsp:Transcript_18041/g.22090  ORF Transcript_18041/g.22090 Transcript_18041/m.22090 type:complete len:308 (+) Transcript_18041:115-1038(+)
MIVKVASFTISLLISSIVPSCIAFSATAKPSTSSLLENFSYEISELRAIAEQNFPETAPTDSVFYLRYLLKDGTSAEERKAMLESNLQWRNNEGKEIVESSEKAVEAAMASGGWDNSPVRDMAPHANIVNKYITTTQCLTTTLRNGDLCYCIRAGQIDDVALMSEVSIEQMTDFFLYCKEVNSIIANMRSVSSDKVVEVLTANDLKGVKLVGGDATFRKALSAASTKANDVYPSLPGPTFLLNLPRVLGALVKLFTPLFPEEVRQRLKFERGPLSEVEDLIEISAGGMGTTSARDNFLDEIDAILAK